MIDLYHLSSLSYLYQIVSINVNLSSPTGLVSLRYRLMMLFFFYLIASFFFSVLQHFSHVACFILIQFLRVACFKCHAEGHTGIEWLITQSSLLGLVLSLFLLPVHILLVSVCNISVQQSRYSARLAPECLSTDGWSHAQVADRIIICSRNSATLWQMLCDRHREPQLICHLRLERFMPGPHPKSAL